MPGTARPLFMGIAPASAATRYLAGTSYTTVTGIGDGTRYTSHPGPARPIRRCHRANQNSELTCWSGGRGQHARLLPRRAARYDNPSGLGSTDGNHRCGGPARGFSARLCERGPNAGVATRGMRSRRS